MTLTHRNMCFKAGIVISVLAIIVIIAAAIYTSPAYSEAQESSIQRSGGGLTQRLLSSLEPAPFVPFATMAASLAYSLVGIILIYIFFEKTQSPEILFMGFFIMSFAFECLRVIIPLKLTMDLPGFYLTGSFRTLLFGRYFGLFSLFAASICAAGLEVQKQQYTVLVCAAASLLMALGVPVDNLSWDSTLVLLNDFGSTFLMIQTGVFVFTIASFLIAAYTRGSRNYIFIGLGSLLTLIGRNMLFNADTWITPFPGLLILSLGTWFICTRFHRIYLWL